MVIKKNWSYLVNFSASIYAMMVAGFCLFIFLGAVFFPEHRVFLKKLFDNLHTAILIILCMYPLLTFQTIEPPNSNNKLYLNTASLPYTKKQLFIKSLIPGIIGILIIVIVTSLLSIFLVEGNLRVQLIDIFSLSKPFLVFFLGSIITFQVIAGNIISLSKGIKMYKVVVVMFLANALLGFSCGIVSSFVGKAITDNNYWAFVIMGIYFVFSLILFLVTFKDIEKISR